MAETFGGLELRLSQFTPAPASFNQAHMSACNTVFSGHHNGRSGVDPNRFGLCPSYSSVWMAFTAANFIRMDGKSASFSGGQQPVFLGVLLVFLRSYIFQVVGSIVRLHCCRVARILVVNLHSFRAGADKRRSHHRVNKDATFYTAPRQTYAIVSRLSAWKRLTVLFLNSAWNKPVIRMKGFYSPEVRNLVNSHRSKDFSFRRSLRAGLAFARLPAQLLMAVF